ncbi:MAG: archease [Thermodesulfobacteriota bacterium]
MIPDGRYTLLNHTADLKIEIYGRDLPDLFTNACFALFDNIADLSRVTGDATRTITIAGEDTADLMINWLRELLALWTVEGLLIKSARIKGISETSLTADILFDSYSPARHVLKTDIKAVTYHQGSVSSGPDGWTARVVVDV